MAVFTSVTEAEFSAWLKDYSLGSLLELQGIASGIENTNYFVTTSNGRFVLTLFEKLTAEELPYYLELMAHLARHGIPCPAPMANRSERFLGELNGKPACIVTRLHGKSLVHPNASHCAAVGAMLAQMHEAGLTFPKALPNPRGPVWRNETAAVVRAFLNEEERQLLDAELAYHAKHPLKNLMQGVVHADLFRDNVLFDGPRVGGLIDFYFACTDALLYDVAITVNDWCTHSNGTPDQLRVQAFLEAYHEVRPFSLREAEMWPVALRAAALRFWLSRLYDLHLPRDGEMVHAHDPAHFRRILQHHVAHANNPIWMDN
jgi:homoserine kinase type II